MEISKEIQDQIRSVEDVFQLTNFCAKNNLKKVQDSFNFRFYVHPIGSYSNRILSPYFCAACGSASAPQFDEWEHCQACTEKLTGEYPDFIVTQEAARKAHLENLEWLAAYYKPI
ncbi:hypothetical protein Q4100_06340 [Acinetobacter baumannii]